MPSLLPQANHLGTPQLGAILAHLDGAYRREQPADEWPTHHAERLVAMVEEFRPASAHHRDASGGGQGQRGRDKSRHHDRPNTGENQQ